MKKRWIMAGVSGILILCCFQVNWALGTSMFSFVFVRLGLEIAKSFKKIFCENRQNLVKQRITPHFLTTDHPNYYEFTTKG